MEITCFDKKIGIKTNNICAKFFSNVRINLNELFDEEINLFWFKKYNKNRFSGLICKLFDGKTKKPSNLTYLIFSTGNIIICGGKTKNQIEQSTEKFIITLQKLYTNAKIVELKFTNICCSIDFNTKIDLIKLYNDRKYQSSFEKELFVNLQYIFNGKHWTITNNGKVFAVGFKDHDKIVEYFENIKNDIKMYFINE